MKTKIKRNALNRGTAVHLGGNRVKFVWPCGCQRTEKLKTPVRQPYTVGATAQLVRIWRANGVVLEECKKHPAYYQSLSPLPRLNAEYQQPEIS